MPSASTSCSTQFFVQYQRRGESTRQRLPAEFVARSEHRQLATGVIQDCSPARLSVSFDPGPNAVLAVYRQSIHWPKHRSGNRLPPVHICAPPRPQTQHRRPAPRRVGTVCRSHPPAIPESALHRCQRYPVAQVNQLWPSGRTTRHHNRTADHLRGQSVP